jgi:hypothetical protein
MNLHDGFDDLAGRLIAPRLEQAYADLGRGRRARRKLRRRYAVVAGAVVAGIVVAGTLVTVAAGASWMSLGTSAGPVPAAGTVAVGRASAAARRDVRLTTYLGEQPQGFRIDTVPDGWIMQDAANHTVVLAPRNAAETKPPYYLGKIVIFLKRNDRRGPPAGDDVKVGASDGVLVRNIPAESVTPAGDTGWTLWIEQPDRGYALVWSTPGLGLSADQMIEIGRGLRVHD